MYQSAIGPIMLYNKPPQNSMFYNCIHLFSCIRALQTSEASYDSVRLQVGWPGYTLGSALFHVLGLRLKVHHTLSACSAHGHHRSSRDKLNHASRLRPLLASCLSISLWPKKLRSQPSNPETGIIYHPLWDR